MKLALAKKLLLTATATVLLIVPAALWADSMTSTNYKITSDSLSTGGGFSSSTNYRLTDTVSEVASPTGEGLASANYRTCVGFQCTGGTALLAVNYAVSATPCTDSTASSPPYQLDLGLIQPATVVTAANHICIRVSSDASSISVTARDDNGGLKSTSVPADVIASQTETLSATNEGYGICSTNVAGGFAALWPFNGTCDASNHQVGALTTSDQAIFSATGTLTNAYGDVLLKAAATTVTKAHLDYADTLTFIVTATY